MALTHNQKTGIVIGTVVLVTFVGIVLMRSGVFGQKAKSAEAMAENKVAKIAGKPASSSTNSTGNSGNVQDQRSSPLSFLNNTVDLSQVDGTGVYSV